MKDTTFKMTGFPQHSGVSPVRQNKDKSHVDYNKLVSGEGGANTSNNSKKKTKTKTKTQKFLAKHPKINKGVDKVKDVATNAWKKANDFVGTDAGKAVLSGIVNNATAPRPKKEVAAIISGEQKSIM